MTTRTSADTLAGRLAACCLAGAAWATALAPVHAATMRAGATEHTQATPDVRIPASAHHSDGAWVNDTVPIPVNRAISLAPHITELIYAAGAGDKIVATVLSSDYPPASRAIPRIGDGLHVSVEKVLSFRPDLVVAWLPYGAAQALGPALFRLHIPLIYSRPEKLADIPAEIIRFGELFHTQAQANAAARSLTLRLHALEAAYAWKTPVSVFIEVGTSPLYTIGKDPLLNDALRLCGGINLYASANIAAPQISMENLLVKQPDVIIAPVTDDKALNAARQHWASMNLQAALRGHVYGLHPDAFFRPGPRLIDATEQLCRYLDTAR